MSVTDQPAAGPAGGGHHRASDFARGRWKQVSAVLAAAIVLLAAWRLAANRESCAPLPDFEAIAENDARKEAFIAYLVPQVEQANRVIAERRSGLLEIYARMAAGKSPGAWDRHRVRVAAEEHGIEPDGEVDRALVAKVLRRVDTVPVSMVVAQAAIESGWGTSR